MSRARARSRAAEGSRWKEQIAGQGKETKGHNRQGGKLGQHGTALGGDMQLNKGCEHTRAAPRQQCTGAHLAEHAREREAGEENVHWATLSAVMDQRHRTTVTVMD